MQILKGNVLKSVTADIILKNTNSYCYVYYDKEIPLSKEYYFVTTRATIEQLEGYLSEYIDNNVRPIDYFIIYTNKTENELFGFIEWLKEHENNFGCRCLLLTCKE